MPMEARIDTFDKKADAETFFRDRVQGNNQIDGLIIKNSGHYSLHKADQAGGEIDDGSAIYVVISFTKGASGVLLDISAAN